MRKTLFMYIIKEMLLYFFVCFLFFFLVFFVNQILLMAENILSKKAPLKDVLLLLFYALPSIITTSTPFAALVGTLMGIGRMVSDREILAMSALGIPLRRVFVAVLTVGMTISIVSFITNDILLPAGTIQFNKLYRKILTSTPALELESNSIKRNQNAIVVSGTIEDDTIDTIMVIDKDDDGNKRIITAPKAIIEKSNDPAIIMTLEMKGANITILNKKEKNSYDVITTQNMSYNILSKNILTTYSGKVKPNEMSSRDLYKDLKIREKKVARISQDSKVAKNDKKTLNMYKMEFHKKFSIPFGAFFFVILAFPLGLTAKTNGQSVGFILGLIVAVLYWAMLYGGQILSVRLGLNGPVMMWLPNAVILFCGIVFLGKDIFR